MTVSWETQLASHDAEHIWVRGVDLAAELIGRASFSEVVWLLVMGRRAAAAETQMIDAILVALMEHGMTPSAVVSRVTYSLAPEAMQGAVAAGLLGVAGIVLGAMEQCGGMLTELVGDDGASSQIVADRVRTLVEAYASDHQRIPGIGHSFHVNGDPRAARLLLMARETFAATPYVDAMELISEQAEEVLSRRLPVNVTGAVSAVLLELGVPAPIHRGFALMARTAGLVAHIQEERDHPITPGFRRAIRSSAAGGA